MSRQILVFWVSAVVVALAITVLIPALFPFGAIGLHTADERERAWLLTLWVGGVFAVLLGLTSILGGLGGIGIREVAESGSVDEAVRTRRRTTRRWGEDEFHRSFDWWLVCTGLLLVISYFVVWLAVR
jgi:hypothetical protein